MRIGRLRHRVTFHGAPITRTGDGNGGELESLTLLGARFAELVPATAANVERRAQAQVVGTISHLLTCRAVRGVTLTAEVHKGERVFQVRGVQDVDDRGVYQVFALDERRP